MNNPYLDKTGFPILKPSVVVFLDILGYSDLVTEAEKRGEGQQLLTYLHETLKKAMQSLNLPNQTHREFQHKSDLYKLTSFTDNIVIGYPLLGFDGFISGEWELYDILCSLSFFQSEMISAGFFLRGGISIGSLYADEIVVYGKGLIDAHRGENQLAHNPRMVLTESAANMVRQVINRHPSQDNPFARHIYEDADGQLFLNYLEYRILVAENELGPDFDELSRHKNKIEKKLIQYQNRPKVWPKYAWAANYHNYFCLQHNYDNEYSVDLSRFQMQPTIKIGIKNSFD